MKVKMVLFMMICPILIFGQTWDYPIKPGSSGWKALSNNQEKVYACQVPQKVLDTINTEYLLELCIKYPLLNDIYVFNNISDGLNKLVADFNGIRELLSRKGVEEILLSKYSEQLDKQFILNSNRSDFEKGEYIVLTSSLELLVTMPQIQNRISLSSRQRIMKELWRGYEIKKVQNSFFRGIGFKTNFSARNQILLSVGSNENISDTFSIKESNEDKFIETIDLKSQEFIKNSNN